MRTVVLVSAGVALAAGLCGLIGWFTGVEAMQRFVPGWATMKFTTAVCLILLSLAFVVPRVPAAVCRLVAGVAGAVVILEYTLSRNLGIDQLVFHDPGGGSTPGRPSLVAAVAILLLAVSHVPPLAEHFAGELLGVVVLAAAVLALLGFLYDVDTLYQLRPYGSLAVPTAAALLALSITRMADPPRGGLRWMLTGRGQAPTLLRSLLVLTFVAQPLIGWATLRANSMGWVSGPSTVVVLTVLCMLSIGALGWFAALRLSRIDQARRGALHDLRALAADLERQVDERVDQIHEGRTEIAVLEDRQRIAADLHDVVIQRLFAAGLTLQAGMMVDPESRVARMETAATEMDAAIRELRASIFELHGRSTMAISLPAAVESAVHEASRILGFEPTLHVDDPDDAAEAVRDDLVAVLRESLANVARHAEATSVQVVLEGNGSAIRLSVTDDGRGMSTTSHRSGTRNIRRRAESRGGECRWLPVEPHGTRLVWTVPDPAAEDEVVTTSVRSAAI